MASIVSAGTTSSTALVASADTTGALVLQTNNGTTALTLDTSQNATFAGYANLPNTFGFKNRIINGAMVIDQRNAGASVSSPNTYTLDRWAFSNGGGQTYTVQQSSTAPTGFVKSLLMTNTNSVAAGTTNYQCLYQIIEGYNIADLGWGTANAQSIAVSFWVRSSVTGTYGSIVRGGASPSAYVSSFSIPTADTWTRITLTVPGCTTDTWNTTNSSGLTLYFDLGVGSTYSAAATGSWTTGNIFGLTGGTKFSATNGATFYVTGVQLEKGSTATSFDYRSQGTELALCQRYLCAFGSIGSTGTNGDVFIGSQRSTTQAWFAVQYPVPMRSTPSLTSVSTTGAQWSSASQDTSVTSWNVSNTPTPRTAFMYGGGSFTVGQTAGLMYTNGGSTTNAFYFSAEL
jgi:hypothetical protein